MEKDNFRRLPVKGGTYEQSQKSKNDLQKQNAALQDSADVTWMPTSKNA